MALNQVNMVYMATSYAQNFPASLVTKIIFDPLLLSCNFQMGILFIFATLEIQFMIKCASSHFKGKA